jgi:hypothetical protein
MWLHCASSWVLGAEIGMRVVETVARIRRAFLVQGKAIKESCREFRLSRKVVRKVIRSDETPEPEEDKALRESKKTGEFKKVCLIDPDDSMATTGRSRRREPSCKQHNVVDDELGVVLDVEVTTGEVNEGEQKLARLDAAAAMIGTAIAAVTADAGYAYAKI